MAAILETVKQKALPAAAAQYETPEVQLLVGLCKQLQAQAGDKPFFLAAGTINELFGLEGDRMRAWRWLRLLVLDEVLVEVQKGDRRHASSFRYVGGD